MTACAEAAIGYHRTLGEELPHVVTSVVVSTRTEDDPDAHNAVIPSAVVVPGAGASTDERLRAVQQQVAERRAAIDRHQGGLDAASRIAGFVPPMVAAAAAIDQARRIDIATSNLPGPPMPMWLAGVPVRWISPLGPVAGTACNITMLTFCDDAALGVHYDPNAVADARLLGSELVSALARLQISCRGRSPRTR
ncbi:MAG: WS/DGAT domain-containing protein [Acidimicrobiales bacterium]